jgi:hypothetical protein
MTLLGLLVFVVILYLTIYFIRIVPLPKPTPPGQSPEWIRVPLICLVVLLAIFWLCTSTRIFESGGGVRFH